MEALGNVSTTSRSLNKPTFNKNKIVKKESINESIKTPATTIIDEKPVSKHLNENNNVTSTDKINELKNENNLYKSNLAEPTLKKLNKKKVLWADTHTNGSKQLEIVQYFYLDEIEREIKRSAFKGGDIAKIEKLNEKELKFKMNPSSFINNTNNSENIDELNNWPSSLIPIDLPESIPIPEIKSIEHEIQLKREQNTLAVLVFKQFLPDSPSEPNESDNLTNTTNPLDFYPTKIIPFEDATLNVQSDMENQLLNEISNQNNTNNESIKNYNSDLINQENDAKFYSKQQQQQQKRQQFQQEQQNIKFEKQTTTLLTKPNNLTSPNLEIKGLPSLLPPVVKNADPASLINFSVSNEMTEKLKQILNTISNKKADSPTSDSPPITSTTSITTTTTATTNNLQDLLNLTKIAPLNNTNNEISNSNTDVFNSRNDNPRKNTKWNHYNNNNNSNPTNSNNFNASKQLMNIQIDNDEIKNNLLPNALNDNNNNNEYKKNQKWNNNRNHNNNNNGWSKHNNGQRFFNKNDNNNNSQQRFFQNNSVETGSSSTTKDNSDDNSTNDNNFNSNNNNSRNMFQNKFKRGNGNGMNRPHFRQQNNGDNINNNNNNKSTFQNKNFSSDVNGFNNQRGNFRPNFNNNNRNRFNNNNNNKTNETKNEIDNGTSNSKNNLNESKLLHNQNNDFNSPTPLLAASKTGTKSTTPNTPIQGGMWI